MVLMLHIVLHIWHNIHMRPKLNLDVLSSITRRYLYNADIQYIQHGKVEPPRAYVARRYRPQRRNHHLNDLLYDLNLLRRYNMVVVVPNRNGIGYLPAFEFPEHWYRKLLPKALREPYFRMQTQSVSPDSYSIRYPVWTPLGWGKNSGGCS